MNTTWAEKSGQKIMLNKILRDYNRKYCHMFRFIKICSLKKSLAEFDFAREWVLIIAENNFCVF